MRARGTSHRNQGGSAMGDAHFPAQEKQKSERLLLKPRDSLGRRMTAGKPSAWAAIFSVFSTIFSVFSTIRERPSPSGHFGSEAVQKL